MKTLLSGGIMFLALLIFSTAEAGDKKGDKKDEKGVTALAPHGLDGAFDKGKTDRDITNGLINNKLFLKAVAEALKAKPAQEAKFRANPKLRDATPAQAARLKFLEVIRDEMKPERKPDE